MKLIDTLVMMAGLDVADPLHERGFEHLTNIPFGDDIYVPSICILEFDVVAKSKGIGNQERSRVYQTLLRFIPSSKVLPLDVKIMRRACELMSIAKWRSKYFDTIIAASALEYKAEIISTDKRLEKLGVKIVW
jgi:predicted nucleic acid-binding protein